MTDTLKEMIQQGDWFEIAKAITFKHADKPQISDRHGDDRFADNILRALEGLPQNGDAEEGNDAAEEGALIEASGYPDPASDRSFA